MKARVSRQHVTTLSHLLIGLQLFFDHLMRTWQQWKKALNPLKMILYMTELCKTYFINAQISLRFKELAQAPCTEVATAVKRSMVMLTAPYRLRRQYVVNVRLRLSGWNYCQRTGKRYFWKNETHVDTKGGSEWEGLWELYLQGIYSNGTESYILRAFNILISSANSRVESSGN